MIIGFNAESKEHKKNGIPIEDSFGFDKKKSFLAVADGVTRDPVEVLPETKAEFAVNYPNPSPAKITSDIFTEQFLKIRNYNLKSVRLAFKYANDKIRNWNRLHIPKPDYLTRDLAGCVASGAIIQGNQFWYGFICDCGIAVFDESGKLKFRTQDEGPAKHDKYIWRDKRLQNISWRKPKARRIIREYYRNNPLEKHSFGVLTGQSNALRYIRAGSGRLKKGDILVVYTDGLEPIIFSEEFSNILRRKDLNGLKPLCRQKVKTEGSLVIYL